MPRKISFIVLLGMLVLAMATAANAAGSAEPAPSEPAPSEPEPAPSEPEPAPPAPSEPAPAPTETGDTGSTDEGTEAWIWALIAIGSVVVLLLVFVVGRGSKSDSTSAAHTLSPQERQGILLSTLSGWTAHGWVVESQSADAAVLRKGADRRQITVDEFGRASEYSLGTGSGQPPPSPPA